MTQTRGVDVACFFKCRILACATWFGIGLAIFANGALAQSRVMTGVDAYPTKPIRFIAPSTPGGGNDTLARMFGAKMTENWGQQVVVDLRPGAGGIIGSEIAARAAPDGYTILIVAGGYALNPYLYAKLPYDTLKDFERVTPVSPIRKPQAPALGRSDGNPE